ncbi:helix-turn-helix domain-containing protein [Ligilactobacillus equi]|uniref:HTH cro/C1-type domain-containing protein n=1 Tax=Ligilactobacillus equi DPC 6820 TaxID=1392007 RepID=V7HVX9_9LACO|nr:helix-turn-helix transcriptional regulator [Ligilactobacillus equi]ETA74072.1 hypothetical protein LEQ_1532 [Ligilactobacillus equi DPC 6820]
MTAEEKLRKNIIRLRESRNWSQKELASRLGMDSSYISKIESGNRKVSTPELNALAGLFEVSADYLLGRDGKGKNQEQNADLASDDVIFTYEGKPIPKEDLELIRRLMRGTRNDI